MTCGDYDIIREGEEVVLKVNCEDCPFVPSLENEPRMMERIMEILSEVGKVTRIILSQRRDYEYNIEQADMLQEVAKFYKDIVKQRSFLRFDSDTSCTNFVEPRIVKFQDVVYGSLKSDPIGAFVELARFDRDEKAKSKTYNQETMICLQPFLEFLDSLFLTS